LGSGFRVQGLWLRIQGSGSRVCMVSGDWVCVCSVSSGRVVVGMQLRRERAREKIDRHDDNDAQSKVSPGPAGLRFRTHSPSPSSTPPVLTPYRAQPNTHAWCITWRRRSNGSCPRRRRCAAFYTEYQAGAGAERPLLQPASSKFL